MDAIADTVGGEVAAELIAKAKQNDSRGYTALLPQSAKAKNPAVRITRTQPRPNPPKVREFADDVRDGKFILPIDRRMPLCDAAVAQVMGEKGGIGKILSWRRIRKADFFTAKSFELRSSELSSRPSTPPFLARHLGSSTAKRI